MTTVYKQSEENAVTWSRQNDENMVTTGVIVKGRIRHEQVQIGTEQVQVDIKKVEIGTEDVQVGTDKNGDPVYESQPVYKGEPVYEEQPVYEQQPYDEWQRMLDQEAAGEITIEWWDQDKKDEIAAEEQVQQFRQERQRLLNDATVTLPSGNVYDADENAQRRMLSAIVAADHRGLPDDYELPWSLAGDGTGVMTTVTLGEIREAHALAIENQSAIWGINNGSN